MKVADGVFRSIKNRRKILALLNVLLCRFEDLLEIRRRMVRTRGKDDLLVSRKLLQKGVQYRRERHADLGGSLLGRLFDLLVGFERKKGLGIHVPYYILWYMFVQLSWSLPPLSGGATIE